VGSDLERRLAIAPPGIGGSAQKMSSSIFQPDHVYLILVPKRPDNRGNAIGGLMNVTQLL
jgi:hypothetical protein